MTISTHLEQRIAMLRFLMIFGVVLLHTPPYVPIAHIGTGPFDLLVATIQHAIFRTSVPVLTFISAYLLFRSGLDQKPVELTRKKLRSIAIPALVFNLVVLAGFVLVSELAGKSMTDRQPIAGAQAWLNAAFGLTEAPINYPLNFARDLLVLMLCAPLMGWLLRKTPWLGLALVMLVFYFELDGPLLLRDVMGPVFYIGGMAAVLRCDMHALDRYAPAMLAMFGAACAAVIYFRIDNTNCLRLAAPLLVWPAASLLVPTAFGAWLARMSKYSFFLFLAHAPILVATSLVYQRYQAYIPYPVYWIVAPVLVTMIVVAMYEAAMRAMPQVFPLLIGKRPQPAAPKKEAAPQASMPEPLYENEPCLR